MRYAPLLLAIVLPASPTHSQSADVAAIVAFVRDAISDEAESASRWRLPTPHLVVLVEDSAARSSVPAALYAAFRRNNVPMMPRLPSRLPGPDTMFVQLGPAVMDSTTATGIFFQVRALITYCASDDHWSWEELRSAAYRCRADGCVRLAPGVTHSGVGIVCKTRN